VKGEIMTNKEIVEKFAEITAKENICDEIEELMILEKEYKKSDFYKHTKVEIYDLYQKYVTQRTLTLKQLFENLRKEINNIDLSHIKDLFGDMSDETKEQIDNYKEEFDALGLDKIINFKENKDNNK